MSCNILCQDIFLLPEAEPDGWSFIKNFVCDDGNAIDPTFSDGKLAVTFVRFLPSPINESDVTEPVTSKLPVNWCLSSRVSPNFVEPLSNMIEEETYSV